jgi:hypothetical protein
MEKELFNGQTEDQFSSGYFTRAAAIACSWASVRAPRLFIWPTPVIAALICAAVLFGLVVVANGL